MRLKISESKNAKSLYVIRSTYINGKHSSKVVEKLGTYDELKKTHDDPITWAKEYIKQLTEQEKEQKREVVVRFKQSKHLPKDKQQCFLGGYLFLQSLYNQLGLPAICQAISSRHKFTYDLDNILSYLLYTRILFPSSKKSSYEFARRFLEPPTFEPHQMYRALEFLATEDDYIQAQLYANTQKLSQRNDRVLYYDCTNFFFEIEQEDNLRKYGASKEHRPNPIVEMGLLMDGDGIPLAYCLHSGSTNEQITLQPLEKKILKDFNLSKFILCTDGGLSSLSNRKYNTRGERAFIATQSLKKLKAHLKDWALSSAGWKIPNSNKEYDLTQINSLTPESPAYTTIYNQIFYKDRWINENGFEQHLIVTYSLKYKSYQQRIREQQVQRAAKAINTNGTPLKKYNSNDYKRLVKKTQVTKDGEIAEKELYELNEERIAQEAQYDGFYAVCTSLKDSPAEIIRINQRRWEIEESFRIMKTEFRTRPVYLSREQRIRAHFLTCFLSLILYRYLEKKTDNKFTPRELIYTLRDMNFLQLPTGDYIPTYTRTDITDLFHDVFGFRTDYEILSEKQMKKILKATRNP
ncbi:MAG: IS1634 family transposase [Megasphaera sp.]|uniref:IS1634 family transposase n=1 Tax=Megasphaera sp. TaxID=2023260 RepID=UPI003F096F57